MIPNVNIQNAQTLYDWVGRQNKELVDVTDQCEDLARLVKKIVRQTHKVCKRWGITPDKISFPRVYFTGNYQFVIDMVISPNAIDVARPGVPQAVSQGQIKTETVHQPEVKVTGPDAKRLFFGQAGM